MVQVVIFTGFFYIPSAMRDSNRGVTASSMGYAQNASSSSEPSKSALKTHKTQGKILALPSSNFGSKNNYSMMHSGAKTHRVHSQTRSPTLVRATTSKVISPAATTTSTTDSHAHLHNRSSSSSMLLSHRASHMSSNGSGHSEDDYL